MMIFLPDKNYYKCGDILDSSRLGNQVWRESVTLLRGGWPNHPAAKLFKGYMHSFCEYNLALAQAMTIRGLYSKKTQAKWTQFWAEKAVGFEYKGDPPWLGDPEFHSRHRGVLIAKGMIDRVWKLRFSHLRSSEAWDMWYGIGLPRKSKQLKRSQFDKLCEYLGLQIQVENTYYGQFEWSEEPMFADEKSGKWPYIWPYS
jgi:hypothetical protein